MLTCCLVRAAAQVSHHPPVSAAHAENSNWTYDIVSAPTTKFLGNSLEVYPKGERGHRSIGSTLRHLLQGCMRSCLT